MKKLALFILMVGGLVVTPSKGQVDAAAMIPYLTTMVNSLSEVNSVMSKSEESLRGITKTLSKINDIRTFMKHAMAVREAINLLVCLAENMSDLQFQGLLRNLGVGHTNLFSDFLTCQYDIYYSTININMDLVVEKVTRAFDLKEDLNIAARLLLVKDVIDEIERTRMRTVSAKGALLEVLDQHVDAKSYTHYVILVNRI